MRKRTMVWMLACGALLVVSAVGFALWALPNYAGYCREQGRFLPDQEMFDGAIADLLASYPPAIPEIKAVAGDQVSIGGARPDRPIAYAGLWDFKSVNPDCCRFV